MDPDAVDPARPWYHPEALTRADVLVEVRLAGGAVVTAKVARHANGRWVWLEARTDAPGGFALLVPWWAPGQRPERLSRRAPAAWRPQAGVLWPDALPERIAGPVYRAPPPAEVAIPEGGEPADGWPHPGLRLGLKVPPDSLAECEARVLRGWRTMLAPGVVATGVGGEVDSVVLIQRAALRMDADPEAHVDRSHIPDVAIAWTPDRRDLGDWEYAMAWTRCLDDRRRRVVAMRAAAPVYSWRQIGERMRLTQARVRQIYDASLIAMFKHATAA